MKLLSTSACMLLLTATLVAQSIQEISVGPSYQRQSFIQLDAGTEKQVMNNAWDIAFSVSGFQDAGIFINESGGSGAQVIELYDAKSTDFSAQPDPAALSEFRLFNSERDWVNGAFNEIRDLANPFDYGWGQYNPQTHQLAGSAVYVLKLRNGEYRKFKVDAYASSTYTFRYANLDGSNEQVKTVNKTEYAGKTLAYFSFTSNSTVDVEPAGGFDLLYCRYNTPLFDPGSMEYIPYAVTGILHGKGIQVAEADNVNPESVVYADFIDSLRSETDVIGYDWKTFSGTAWAMDLDRVFFLKNAQNRVWKLFFIDFEGSATGTTVMEKTDLGIISKVQDPAAFGLKTLLYPNPVAEQLYVSLDLPAGLAQEGVLRVNDIEGRTVLNQLVALRDGFQVLQVNAAQWTAGFYSVQLILPQTSIQLGKIVR